MLTCAIPLLHSRRKTIVTTALETANGVPACSICAEALKHFTFIHIYQERESRVTRQYIFVCKENLVMLVQKITNIYLQIISSNREIFNVSFILVSY